MLKIYPCLVTKKTKLHSLWKKKAFQPLTDAEAADFIARVKEVVPNWVRVMRIQRDIPADLIEAGVKAGNLRELVHEKLKARGKACHCIRCREAGLKSYKENLAPQPEKARLFREDYAASQGQEVFLSQEDKGRELLYGFARLRLPYQAFRQEISEESALLRELHVYSSVVGIGGRAGQGEFQHRGLGKSLLAEAERIAREEFEKKELVVISGLGVKPYYQKFGYQKKGPYMAKKLA
jgi:elongator complex protein 3